MAEGGREKQTPEQMELAQDRQLIDLARAAAKPLLHDDSNPHHFLTGDEARVDSVRWRVHENTIQINSRVGRPTHLFTINSTIPLQEPLTDEERDQIRRFIANASGIHRKLKAIGDQRASAVMLRVVGMIDVQGADLADTSPETFAAAVRAATDFATPGHPDRMVALERLAALTNTPERHLLIGLAHLDLAGEQLVGDSGPDHAPLAARHLRRAAECTSSSDRQSARWGLFQACLIGEAYKSAERALQQYPLDPKQLTRGQQATLQLFHELHGHQAEHSSPPNDGLV